jgi:two-component system, LuxR family, response regulator FixJ
MPCAANLADSALFHPASGALPNTGTSTGERQMSVENPTVYVVDDDPELRESLTFMIGSMGLNVKTYPSAEAFLDGYSDSPDTPKCMVLDVLMPGLSGLGLQQMLMAEGRTMPIIMISGCADIPMAVKAMRAGALDFLEKPISSQTLSTRIREAIDHCVRQQRDTCRKTELTRHIDRLSARQREVLDLLVAGERSKQIARQLGIGEKTVAKHRATVLEKMQVDSVVELVRLFADANLSHTNGHAPIAQCN